MPPRPSPTPEPQPANPPRRHWLAQCAAAGLGGAAVLAGCGGKAADAPAAPPGDPTRTWRMGFSPQPPRLTVEDVLRTVDLWGPRAELFIIHEDLPWRDLLGGSLTPEQILQRDKVELVAYCRAKGAQLVFVADLTDGLDRSAEASALRALGRSLAEPAVQAAARAYVRAVVALLKPEYLGLAAETNLVRAAAPPALYEAVRSVANAAAADVATAVSASGAAVVPFSSVQVELAWGKLGPPQPFQGIARDRADFPFARALGLSSYPYFAYATPEDIPDDYYARVLASAPGPALPAFVAEGGWPSQGASANGVTITSTAALQARYIKRQAALLDRIAALAYLQIPFADFDVDDPGWPKPLPPNLPLFVTLGMTDARFNAKPALAEWDALFQRRRV